MRHVFASVNQMSVESQTTTYTGPHKMSMHTGRHVPEIINEQWYFLHIPCFIEHKTENQMGFYHHNKPRDPTTCSGVWSRLQSRIWYPPVWGRWVMLQYSRTSRGSSSRCRAAGLFWPLECFFFKIWNIVIGETCDEIRLSHLVLICFISVQCAW